MIDTFASYQLTALTNLFASSLRNALREKRMCTPADIAGQNTNSPEGAGRMLRDEAYPERTAEIFLSQGHTTMTSLHHYLNMPFLQSDKEQMLEWTGGLFEK
jgi:hypothetical protein